MIDRFGKLPAETENLLTVMNIKLNSRHGHVAKIDVGPKGALVSFWDDKHPNPEALLSYVEKLNGVAKLRPDMKLSVVRTWGDPKARLNGIHQLSKGLAKLAA